MATFDLFGFNWARAPALQGTPAVGPPAAVRGGGGVADMAAEKAFVARLVAAGGWRVHPTPCASQNHCASEVSSGSYQELSRVGAQLHESARTG